MATKYLSLNIYVYLEKGKLTEDRQQKKNSSKKLTWAFNQRHMNAHLITYKIIYKGYFTRLYFFDSSFK